MILNGAASPALENTFANLLLGQGITNTTRPRRTSFTTSRGTDGKRFANDSWKMKPT